MRILISLVLLGLVFAQDTAGDTAAEVSLSPDELFEVFNGNIFEGEWAGRPYRQVFLDNGVTHYTEGRNTSSGFWRVEDDGEGAGRYCSQWPPSQAWDCYTVKQAGEELVWYSGDNRYYSRLKD